MANKYIVRVEVACNGTNVTDFRGFTESAIVRAKAVHLMHSTGAAQLTRRFGFVLDYVKPQASPIDWHSFVTGDSSTAVITYDNGDTLQYGGVEVIDVGEWTTEGENEPVQKVTFMAASRNGETE
jgi:hypothetical protein